MICYNITAYNLKVKLVLRNNKEKVICNNKNDEGEMQMKRSKNLERAIVLGLILSTGVCGSAWAENNLEGHFIVNGAGNPDKFPTIDYDKTYNNIDISMSGVTGNRTTMLFGVNGIGQSITKVFTAEDGESITIVNTAGSTAYEGLASNNDTVFALGGSTINLSADKVYITAIGSNGLMTDNAISAKNTIHSDAGDNTVNISGGTVQIIGDIDFSGSTQDGKDTVNLNLSGADSYWYGKVKGADEDNIANISLSNGAEWIYRYQGKLNLDVTMGGNIHSIKNDGNYLKNLALNGGVVNLDDDEIKNICANTVVKNGEKEYKLEDYFKGLNTDLSAAANADDFWGQIELGLILVQLNFDVNHQSVEIENLTGMGGIFKADIDWLSNNGVKQETDTSDYIYIKNSKEGSKQVLKFDASKAHLENMEINEDKLYFANVADGNTSFITASSVYSNAGNVFDYTYGTGSEDGANDSEDWYIAVSGKSAESNPNFSAAKGAMYAGYALGTELDTLNKRMGEARYLEEDDGVWVRYRHSKTGWDDTYETNGDMFQLGFDNEVTEKDGKHYRGVAIDYTDADTNIMGISGEGEHERYAVSLYDTWLGEKGHYRDFVLRGGRINSDYDISGAFSKGYEDIGGDYHQWFGSISAEWGRKNDMGTGWYFEPQVQAQLARVGGASYVSDSGVDVDQDGATSLIGRAGFRIGREYVKDNGKHDNFYIKADLLHEFAGDKSFSLDGNDGRYDKEYDGQETWCDIGIGADISLGKNSYFWADVERTFGADFDNTWQINGGFRWEF